MSHRMESPAGDSERTQKRMQLLLPQFVRREWSAASIDEEQLIFVIVLSGLCVQLQAEVHWDQFIPLGPSWDQKPLFYGRNQWAKRRKDNRIIVSYGAGDGNRTHVRSLGKFEINPESDRDNLSDLLTHTDESDRLLLWLNGCK